MLSTVRPSGTLPGYWYCPLAEQVPMRGEGPSLTHRPALLTGRHPLIGDSLQQLVSHSVLSRYLQMSGKVLRPAYLSPVSPLSTALARTLGHVRNSSSAVPSFLLGSCTGLASPRSLWLASEPLSVVLASVHASVWSGALAPGPGGIRKAQQGLLVLLMCCGRPVGAVTSPGEVFEGRVHLVHPGTPGQESVCWQVNVTGGWSSYVYSAPSDKRRPLQTFHPALCKDHFTD